jgi:hypothetical protein
MTALRFEVLRGRELFLRELQEGRQGDLRQAIARRRRVLSQRPTHCLVTTVAARPRAPPGWIAPAPARLSARG